MTGHRRPADRRTVNGGLTPELRRRVVENEEFAAFSRRILRAAGRRIAAGDVESLPALAQLAGELDAAIGDAVAGLRQAGYSWTEIAGRLGVSKQAAHQRWSAPLPAPAQGQRRGVA